MAGLWGWCWGGVAAWRGTTGGGVAAWRGTTGGGDQRKEWAHVIVLSCFETLVSCQDYSVLMKLDIINIVIVVVNVI